MYDAEINETWPSNIMVFDPDTPPVNEACPYRIGNKLHLEWPEPLMMVLEWFQEGW